MTYMAAPDGGQGGPEGSSFAGLYTRADRETVVTALAQMRFSGWVGPQEGDWVVSVPSSLRGAVAGGKRSLEAVAKDLSAAVEGPAFSLGVTQDRLLTIYGCDRGVGLLSYLSDPTVADPHDDEAVPDPVGAEDAPAFASALGLDEETGEQLEELLAEELTDSVNESERTTSLLRLLGAPTWVVAADALPKDVPTGPRAKEFTRLGAGRSGLQGRLDDAVRGVVRKRQ